jgi:hypothetical protein
LRINRDFAAVVRLNRSHLIPLHHAEWPWQTLRYDVGHFLQLLVGPDNFAAPRINGWFSFRSAEFRFEPVLKNLRCVLSQHENRIHRMGSVPSFSAVRANGGFGVGDGAFDQQLR